MTLTKSFETFVRKGENAGTINFLYLTKFSDLDPLIYLLTVSRQSAFNLEDTNILLCGKWLNWRQFHRFQLVKWHWNWGS